MSSGPLVQRETNPAPTSTNQPDPLTASLTDSEWRQIDRWLARGEVFVEPLTDNDNENANIIAGELFCQRALFAPGFGEGEDPLLCVLREVTTADRRVQALKQHVIAHGPIIHWAAVSRENRIVYVMERLINTYHYPDHGAAGIVGNLLAESGVLPSRIEGSAEQTPLRASDFGGTTRDFTAEEVQNRSSAAQTGPRMPGIGLAQWTTPGRRAGLFQRQAQGTSILFNMDAQVDYLVGELQANAGLNGSLTAGGVSVNTAADNVVYQFEIPGAILDASGNRLPRSDPAVQAVFTTRRNNAQAALQAYQTAHPANP